MALLKRLLHSQRVGDAPDDADRWYLVFDTDTKHLCVLHEWHNADDERNGEITVQTVELEVSAYLATGEGPGQREVIRLVKTLFKN